MKLLLILTLLGAVVLLPFVVIRRPWAIRLWDKVKMVVIVYIIVIVVASIVRLVFNFDAIYG